MKMPEKKHDLPGHILTAKEQGIGAILAFGNGVFSADIMAARLQKQ